MNHSDTNCIRVGPWGAAMQAFLTKKRQLIKNKTFVILSITLAQTLALYIILCVCFLCMSNSSLLDQRCNHTVASGRCHGRCAEEQKGSLDKKISVHLGSSTA